MNNSFIPKEEFLKQSEKVQDVFYNWLTFNSGDVANTLCYVNGEVLLHKNTSRTGTNEIIPLLQMHQLIDFIENKLKCKVINFKLVNCMDEKGEHRFWDIEYFKKASFGYFKTERNFEISNF